MLTITTGTVIVLGVKVAIFIGGVLAIIYLENLINKKPTFKKEKGGHRHDGEHGSESTFH